MKKNKTHKKTVILGLIQKDNIVNVARGFTLIELLVVVLIIGILAAVALPQYNKAVEKARAAEAIAVLNTLQKGIDMYLLEHGYPPEDTVVTFLGESEQIPDYPGGDDNYYQNTSLDIELSGLVGCSKDPESQGYCYSKDFIYYAWCNSESCVLYATRGAQAEYEERGEVSGSSMSNYILSKWNFPAEGWHKSCYGKCPSGLVW